MTNLNTALYTLTSWGVAVLELRADELETGVGTVTTETVNFGHQNRCTGNWVKCAWVMLPIAVSENTWFLRQRRWIHKRVKGQTSNQTLK